ncbi:hypothetical protein [Chitinophaga flava]|uniref:Uncharacterized protein n=1 Tax=Chitinophaga flava TaxID=2259036 RepID=A0A365Y2M0_9BACT|nr:hypothetical protein [Chitinophaga flava]RBL92125.1 hypothetical protein DF182_05890 [Chitinophaga flava]
MEHIPENIKVVARFILTGLQRALSDISQTEQQQLSQGLTAISLHLPVILLNTGLTKTLIPASHIYCQLQHNLLGVYAQETGTFLLDITKGSMIVSMRPTGTDTHPTIPAYQRNILPHQHISPDGFIHDDIEATADEKATVNLMKSRQQIKHFSATQLPHIQFKNDDLPMPDTAPEGGYLILTRMLNDYCRYRETYAAGLHPSDAHPPSFSGDAGRQPHKYFIPLNVEEIISSGIDLSKTGIIRVNPRD